VQIGLLAFVFLSCAFYALFAVDAFDVKQAPKWGTTMWVHQVWLNFCGAAFGWGALFLFLERRTPRGELEISDFVLGLVAFVGITGHIPMFIVGGYEWLRKYSAHLLTPKP
jgi:hypothetical protein